MTEATEPITVNPVLLTLPMAAAWLSMSATAFRTQEAAGRIGPRPVRFGRSVRYVRSELERWAAAGCPRRVDWLARGKDGDARPAGVPKMADV